MQHRSKLKQGILSSCLNVTGYVIAETIKVELDKLNLNMANCRGQAYDGAASMSGVFRGTAALITKDYPKAVYQHCRAHCLNLTLMKTCTSISEISK